MLRPSKITVLLVLVSMGALGCFNKTSPRSNGDAALSWKEPALIEAWVNAYHDSAFGYCDAELLAAFWGHEVADAKARVGMKLQAGATELEIEKWHLGPARERAMDQGRTRCDIFNEGYSYEDVKAVSYMMGITEADAKVLLSEKLFYSGRVLTDLMLEDAYMGTEGEYYYEEGVNDEGYFAEKFWLFDTPWCDAVVVSKAWNVTHWDAKVAIGMKLANGFSPEEIEANFLGGLRQQLLATGDGCTFDDAGYKFRDMQSLSCAWGLSLEESKDRVRHKLTLSQSEWVDAQINQARATCPG